jgi:hypothetical protein
VFPRQPITLRSTNLVPAQSMGHRHLEVMEGGGRSRSIRAWSPTRPGGLLPAGCLRTKQGVNAGPEAENHPDGENVGPDRGDIVPMIPGAFASSRL